MYDQHYDFHTLPFENTPDPRFFFASEQHREALAAVEYTIRMRKGFVLVTGDIGAGKTTVGRTMCQRCGDTAKIVHVHHGRYEGVNLVKQVLRALDLPADRRDDRGELLDRLRENLMARLNDKQPVVLFVDEAQTLSDAALEELRLLSNFDTCTQKPVQVVLIGQPELRTRLAGPHMTALRQRIAMAKHLRPLSREDVGKYIEHRIRAASKDPENVKVSFDTQAVDAIHQYALGVPRIINMVCDNALLVGYVRQLAVIDYAVVDTVLDEMVPAVTTEPVVTVDKSIALAA